MKPTEILADFIFQTSWEDIPEEAFYLQGIQFAKRGIASDLQNFFSPDTIVFTEIFTKPSPPPSEDAPEQDDDSGDTQPVP